VRGCLTTFFVLIALLLVACWLFLPAITSGAVDRSLGLAGFDGRDRRVTVDASSPFELVALHADSIRVQATDASYRGLLIGTVDVTLHDVALVDRTAGSIDGTLTTVQFTAADGTPITVASIGLSGSGTAVDATIALSPAQIRTIAATAVERTIGTVPTKVTLVAPDRATVVVGGRSVSGRLVVDAGGGLVFQPAGTTGPVAGPIDLIRPGPDVPLRLRSISVGPSGATVGGSIDPALFRG
jgi:hypothetical protein